MAHAPMCFRVADLADRWNCSASKIRKMIRTGELGCLQIGGMLRIPIVEVEACEERSKVKVEAAGVESIPEDGGRAGVRLKSRS